MSSYLSVDTARSWDLQGARVWLSVTTGHVLKLPGGDKVRSDGERSTLSPRCSEVGEAPVRILLYTF